MKRTILTMVSVVLLFSVSALAQEMTNEEIAKASQNPITMIYSIPIQDNMYMDIGPDGEIKNVANFQPVIPLDFTKSTDLVLRMIMPITTVPPFLNGTDHSLSGLGDITLSAFFAPKKVDKLIWGAGFVAYFPTATIDPIRSKQWGIGPSIVGLTMSGKWTYGALIMNVWSLNGSDKPRKIDFLQIQPFINYNLGEGWFLTTVPIIIAAWDAPSGNQWTVPLGGGAGKGFKMGKLPVSATVQAYYNIVKPDVVGETWQLRLQAQIFFPRK
jgi:hypothetical protein